MNKWAIAVGVLVLIVVGFLFFRLPQPIIEIAPEALFSIGGFKVTNTIFTSWVMIALIALITILGTRRLALVPSGFQNLFEALVEGFGNIVSSVAGERNGRRFFPVVFIIFLYIVACNWTALTPLFNVIGVTENVGEELIHEAAAHPNDAVHHGELRGWVMSHGGISTVPLFTQVELISVKVEEGKTTNAEALALFDTAVHDATGHSLEELEEDGKIVGFIAPFLRGVNTDLNAPLGYAIWSAIFVELWGITALGFFTYGSKFFNFKRLLTGDIMNGIIDVFVGFLELISEFARLISFTFRLFGNIFAGEVLLFMMTFLLPFVFVDIFYGLELFVGLIQGFVFAMLTLVFGVMAVSGHGGHAEGHGAGHAGEHGTAHA